MALPTDGTRRCEHVGDTQALGEEWGSGFEAGDVIILDGPLGAGKTALTQGIARGMGVTGRVTSPTFVIAREHRSPTGGPTLIHVDAYRLLGEDPEADTVDVDALGALDSLDLDSELDECVVVAEWGGGIVDQLADRYLLVHLDRDSAHEADPDSSARILSWEIKGAE